MQSDSPLFTVVVPVFNRAHLVGATLDSALAQTERSFEVIVVDDGSTDATPEVLASYGDRVRVLGQRNRGPGAARNLALRHVRGRYVCPLDSDDLWFPWTLATFRDVLERSGWPATLAGECQVFHDPSELPRAATPTRFERFADHFEASRRGYHLSSGMSAYRTDLLRAVGGFDPSLWNAEDHDLALRIGTAPGFVKVLAPVTVGYRQHAGSVRQLDRTADALAACLRKERRSVYAGAAGRAAERRRQLTFHTRPLSVACARAGRAGLAARLYLLTLPWNLRQGRLRYLLGLPALVGWGLATKRAAR